MSEIPDSFYLKFESKRLRWFVDAPASGHLNSSLKCQRAAIFARCAVALVVVVHACALARGGC